MILLFGACSSQYYMNRGDLSSESGRYYQAATRYGKSYHKAKVKSHRFEAAWKAGEAYERINRLKESFGWYRRADQAGNGQAEVCLKLAEVCRRLGERENAERYALEYEEATGTKGNERGLDRWEQGKETSEEGSRYRVFLMKEFNSRASDFAPTYFPEDTCTVYFTSTRPVDLRKRRRKGDPVTGEGYSHIYCAHYAQEIKTKDKGKTVVRRFRAPRWTKPAACKDSLFSNRNDGTICFTPDGDAAYFTSSRLIKGTPSGTRIYKAYRAAGTENEDDEKVIWNRITLAGICGDTVSAGHPALSPDGERLYFVTDELPGGFGGKDIWYVEARNGRWGAPVNAGAVVNTSGNEMFPYVRDNGELYFASDGHPGRGGLDLFKIESKEGKEVLVHLPAPLNSQADDFGIAFKPGKEEGLLSSSRAGRGDHLYAFYFIPQQLQAGIVVTNDLNGQPVGEMRVTVVGDDGSRSYGVTDSLGVLEVPLLADREYLFVAENPDYLKGKGKISTYGETGDRRYELAIAVQPIGKPIVIPDIYFDLAQWELREDARESLEGLLQILEDNPNITIELAAHTDQVGEEEANLVLSEKRARAVVDYLIGKGVCPDRLQARGYGEAQPRLIDERKAAIYPFLKAGEVLDEKKIESLEGEQRELALQLNRRTEFRVIRTDYRPMPDSLRRPEIKENQEENGKAGETRLKPLSSIEGTFYTLQLGLFRKIPRFAVHFPVMYTEQVKPGIVRYCTGVYTTREAAVRAGEQLKRKGIECMIKKFDR